MVLVLCLGDLHVPYRTSDLPQQFKDILLPGKVQQILCTGDVCSSEMFSYLKSICTNVHIVKGQFDEDHSYPETKVSARELGKGVEGYPAPLPSPDPLPPPTPSRAKVAGVRGTSAPGVAYALPPLPASQSC